MDAGEAGGGGGHRRGADESADFGGLPGSTGSFPAVHSRAYSRACARQVSVEVVKGIEVEHVRPRGSGLVIAGQIKRA